MGIQLIVWYKYKIKNDNDKLESHDNSNGRLKHFFHISRLFHMKMVYSVIFSVAVKANCLAQDKIEPCFLWRSSWPNGYNTPGQTVVYATNGDTGPILDENHLFFFFTNVFTNAQT